MSNEIAIPDYLKDMMDSGAVKSSVASMDAGAGSVPRITTRGKVFRKKDGEDETKLGDSVDVVILGINPEHGMAHTYYAKGYSPDSSDPPDCSSQNGVRPDPWISSPQNRTCADCPNQVWGSAKSMSGGKAKACRDSKHLFVALAKEFADDPENCTLWLLQVTVNSLRDFGKYGKELAAKGLPGPEFVITHIAMDDEASVPKLVFSLRGVLSEKLGKPSYERAQKGEWKSLQLALPQGDDSGANNKRALPDSPSQTGLAESKQEVIESDQGKDDKSSVDDLIQDW